MSVIDLDLKIITLNKVDAVYAKDSLDMLTKDLSELKKVLNIEDEEGSSEEENQSEPSKKKPQEVFIESILNRILD